MSKSEGVLDGLFSYRMTKTVKVNDRYLTVLSNACYFLILGYIVVWKLGLEKAYLEYEPVVGYVKQDLIGSTPQINIAEEEYCRDMKCRLCDAHDVRYPNTDTREPLITTYVREARQERVCHRNATRCPFASPFQTVLWDDYLVAGIQHFQLKLYHSVQAPTFFFQSRDKRFVGDSKHMHGRLVKRKQGVFGGITTVKDFPSNSQDDKFTIAEILEAAGVDLDHVLPGHIRPIRETGTTIYCHIRYFNDYTFLAPASRIRYEYEFVHGDGVEAIYEPVHLGVAWTSPVDVEERMMLTRRGVKLVWTQEGALGRGSFSALMITIAIALAMFKIVSLVGDLLAARILPSRNKYRGAAEDVIGDYAEEIDDSSSSFIHSRGGAEYGSLGQSQPRI
mmetsp:Transcript_10383/g.23749  ORF Transcript_10383/g.23749 Transcript_10383/m.23749 type:complete len:392 (+) Transcript_10383:74-1249(+)